MEHYTKKNRIYVTSESYLKKVRTTCLLFAMMSILICASVFFGMGLTFLSLGIIAVIGLLSLLFMRYIWKNARTVSLKSGNIILKTMGSKNVVAPVGSIRKIKTSNLFGYKLTRIHYRIDGAFSKFFILTRSFAVAPEELIKEEISLSRKRKKEANHKPDSVLTQIA